MEQKKFAVVSISLNDYNYTVIHSVEAFREWIHGRSNILERSLTPLAYLSDSPDNPVEESTLDISYHIEFQEFSGELLEDYPKTFQIGDKTISLSKTILNIVCINLGIEPDMVTDNEYKLWHNDRGQFIELTYKGFENSSGNNPTLTLIYDGVIKESIFVKVLMGDV